MAKKPSKKEQFHNLIDNVLWELAFELDIDMYEHWKKMPDGPEKEAHMAAMATAGRISMDLLRIVSREFNRIYGIKDKSKCCDVCEARVKMWQNAKWNGGLAYYKDRNIAITNNQGEKNE